MICIDNWKSQINNKLRQQVLDLVAEVHALRVEVDYLKKENQSLLRK